MDAQTVFEQHGLQFADAEEAMAELSVLDSGELWNLTEDLIGDNVVGIEGDEDTQADILRIALVNALTENSETLTQADIDLAQERALDLGSDVDEEADETPVSAKTNGKAKPVSAKAQKPAKRTRKRTSESRETIKNLVAADPEASREDILEQAFEQGADVAESTAVMYFYDVRKELGLEPNGKRGRKPTNSIDTVRELIEANWDTERGELIELISSELGYKPNTATVYYHEALKAINEEYGEAA